MASISAGAAPHGRKALNPSLALVPFLDLLVCCVMFLLVTAVWNELGRVQVSQRVPGTNADLGPAPPRITRFLAVRAAGYELGSSLGERMWIARGDPEQLRIALRAQRALDASDRPALTVTADDGVSYQELVSVMDHALGAGFGALDIGEL